MMQSKEEPTASNEHDANAKVLHELEDNKAIAELYTQVFSAFRIALLRRRLWRSRKREKLRQSGINESMRPLVNAFQDINRICLRHGRPN